MTGLAGRGASPGHTTVTIIMTTKHRRIGNHKTSDIDSQTVAGRDIHSRDRTGINHPCAKGRSAGTRPGKGLIVAVIGRG